MKRHIRIATAVVAAAIAGGAASLASAQEKPCMADAARLCPGVEPGEGAQIACLKQHKEDLSPGCKKRVMQMKIKHEEQKQLQEQQQGTQPPR
jgi:hypothetical protein